MDFAIGWKCVGCARFLTLVITQNSSCKACVDNVFAQTQQDPSEQISHNGARTMLPCSSLNGDHTVLNQVFSTKRTSVNVANKDMPRSLLSAIEHRSKKHGALATTPTKLDDSALLLSGRLALKKATQDVW